MVPLLDNFRTLNFEIMIFLLTRYQFLYPIGVNLFLFDDGLNICVWKQMQFENLKMISF